MIFLCHNGIKYVRVRTFTTKKKKKEQKQKGNEVPYIPVVQPVVQPWFALKPKESG